MNREEVKNQVALIIDEKLDNGVDTNNVAGFVLDFLDSIGYDASHELGTCACGKKHNIVCLACAPDDETLSEKVDREFG